MREFVFLDRTAGRNAWLVPFVPGVALVVFGLLIVLLPQLLIAMVAALFVLGGIALISLGWRIRSGGPRGRGGFRVTDWR